MDIDFHYYATYVAAVAAGYSDGEAATIAHAAQYIDDSDAGRLLGHSELGFFPVPTVQTNEQLGWGRVTSNLTDLELRKVWVPFHFLPGNYKSKVHPDSGYQSRVKPFTGRRSDSGLVDTWTYDARAEEEFKLLCLPYSPMAVAMIADTLASHRTDLHMIGVRIHVLIDTFAHMYFAGTPAWHVNSLGDVYDISEGGAGRKIAWGGANDEWATVDGLTYNSFMYVGHARIGHLPDYPWLKYKYTPQWSETPVIKDSREEYVHAFTEMFGALRALRLGHAYVPKTTSVEPELMSHVKGLINASLPLGMKYESNTGERISRWVHAIPTMKKPDGTPMRVPPVYDADVWLNAAKENLRNHAAIQTTDYYKFNMAARLHVTFVERELASEGINLLEAPSETTGPIWFGEEFTLMDASDRRHVSAMEAKTQYWPRMGNAPVALRFDLPENQGFVPGAEPIVSDGREIRIQTTEAGVKDYVYLGIWGRGWPYYYTRGYDEQLWVIHREDPKMTGPIVYGERIYLKNKSNGQFLCTNGDYLGWTETPHAWLATAVVART